MTATRRQFLLGTSGALIGATAPISVRGATDVIAVNRDVITRVYHVRHLAHRLKKDPAVVWPGEITRFLKDPYVAPLPVPLTATSRGARLLYRRAGQIEALYEELFNRPATNIELGQGLQYLSYIGRRERLVLRRRRRAGLMTMAEAQEDGGYTNDAAAQSMVYGYLQSELAAQGYTLDGAMLTALTTGLVASADMVAAGLGFGYVGASLLASSFAMGTISVAAVAMGVSGVAVMVAGVAVVGFGVLGFVEMTTALVSGVGLVTGTDYSSFVNIANQTQTLSQDVSVSIADDGAVGEGDPGDAY